MDGILSTLRPPATNLLIYKGLLGFTGKHFFFLPGEQSLFSSQFRATSF
jgi:hypothetical protein